MLALSSKRIPFTEEAFPGGETVRLYDDHARRYMRPVYRHFAYQIAKARPCSGKVLDIGTGSGLLAIELAGLPDRDYEITGIDISNEMLEAAERNIRQAGLSHRIKLERASAAAIPLTGKSFDAVVSNASLHHWKDPSEVFKEIKRIIQPGGICLIRDNMRLSPLFSPLINLICWQKKMSEKQRDLWVKAIRASYTPAEVKKILAVSGFKGSKVSINFTFLDLSIYWTPGKFA